MSDADIPKRLQKVIADTLSVDAADVAEDASSETLEGWDSLAHQNLLLAVAKAFGITFSADEGDGLQDFASLRAAIVRKRAPGAPPADTPAPAGPQYLPVSDDVPVLVIGDSNARAFAYHAAFLPITVAQGARANLLTAQSRAFVDDRVAHVLKHADARCPVLLCLPGTFMHHFRNTYGTLPKGDSYLSEMAEAYVALACRVRDAHKRKVAVAAVPPVRGVRYAKAALAFSRMLQQRCAANAMPFVDGYADVLDGDFKIKDAYWGDIWHIGPNIAPRFAEALTALGFLKEGQGGAHAWTYRYFITPESVPVDVWGDFPREGLSHERTDLDYTFTEDGPVGGQTYRWPLYHARTHEMEDVMRAVSTTVALWRADQAGSVDVTVLDCREGHAAFAWNVPNTRRVAGLDHDPGRIARARWLAPFFGGNFSFMAAASYGGAIEGCDVVVALERMEFTDEYYQRLFADIRGKTRAFAFLSDAGAAHINLLRQAGFADVFDIPVPASDGSLHLPRTRKVVKNTRAFTAGRHLLVAFAEKTNDAFRSALRQRIGKQLGRHQRAMGDAERQIADILSRIDE